MTMHSFMVQICYQVVSFGSDSSRSLAWLQSIVAACAAFLCGGNMTGHVNPIGRKVLVISVVGQSAKSMTSPWLFQMAQAWKEFASKEGGEWQLTKIYLIYSKIYIVITCLWDVCGHAMPVESCVCMYKHQKRFETTSFTMSMLHLRSRTRVMTLSRDLLLDSCYSLYQMKQLQQLYRDNFLTKKNDVSCPYHYRLMLDLLVNSIHLNGLFSLRILRKHIPYYLLHISLVLFLMNGSVDWSVQVSFLSSMGFDCC